MNKEYLEFRRTFREKMQKVYDAADALMDINKRLDKLSEDD